MFSFPFGRGRHERKIDALYGAIVAQARQPVFYADYGVADTVSGRFDLIVLHLALVLRALRDAPEADRPLGQGVFDAFCQDMDGNLREMGVGDLGVPKEMRRFGEAFYGRAAAYDRALAPETAAELEETLTRNVFGGTEHPSVTRLAAYVRRAEADLRRDYAWVATGRIPFPDPAAVQAAAQPSPAAC